MTRTNLKNLSPVLALLFTLLALACLLPSPAHAGITVKSTASPGLNAGLVGYWSFEEGTGNIAYDKSGRGNNGTLTNMSESIPWVQGNTGLGNALKFDGVDDYVNLGSSPALNLTGSMTISAWINTKTIGGREDITADDTSAGGIGQWLLEVSRTASNGKLSFGWGGNSGLVLGSTVLSVNTWYHVVAVRSGSSGAWTGTIYINGAVDVSTGAIATNPGTQLGSSIGQLGVQNQFNFNGSINDVRIYNRALSQAEITRLYKLKKTALQGPDQTGMVGWWKMDEGQGTVAGDSSGNRNSGTLSNMASPATATSGWGGGKKNHGTGLLFDGVNDYVDLGSTLSNTGQMSISAWINPSSVIAGRKVIFGNHDSAATTGDYSLNINNTAGKLEFNWGGAVVLGGSQALSVSTWYHVVAVRSGSSGSWTAKIYINGVQDASGTTATNPNGSGARTAIGRAGADAVLFFNGSIDEVRIYNRALSQTEITKIYKEKAGVKIGVAPNNPTLNTGLVGYWNFDGKNTFPTSATPTTLDLSGNNNTGILTNGPVPTVGKLGQALSFDGVDDYVDAGAPASLNFGTGDFTLSVWVKPADTTAREIINKALPSGTFAGYELRRGDGVASVNAPFQFWPFNTSSNAVSSITIPTTGLWYHVVAYRSGGTIGIAVNGVIEATAANSVDVSSSQPLRIGFDNTGWSGTWWNGSIDEVRIYNRALSAAEIKRLYNGGRTGN